MSDYKRLTKKSWHDCKFAQLNPREVLYKLWQLENKIENGTLVDIETVAKLMVEVFDDCPCNFVDIAEYMCEHYYDWCDKSCVSVSATGDYTPCWVKYLTAKLEELKRGQNDS